MTWLILGSGGLVIFACIAVTIWMARWNDAR